MSDRCIAIIPARAGSVRIPGKNMKLFHGKPILQYSIEKAIASKLFEQIIVSSEDGHTLDFAKSAGALGVFRPINWAEDSVGTCEVARSVLRSGFLQYDIICTLYATAPLMSIKDLTQGLRIKQKNPTIQRVFSVGPDGKDAGQFYWETPSYIMLHDTWPPEYMADKEVALKIDASRTCDINTPEDWVRAESMYLALGD